MTDHPYMIKSRWGEMSLDTPRLVADLAKALGATVKPDEMAASEFSPGTIIIGEMSIYVRSEHGAKKGRARISIGAPELARKLSHGGPDAFPAITVDASRPLDKLATEVRRRVIEPAAAPLAALKARIEGEHNARADCERHAARIRAAHPKANIAFRDASTTEANFYMNTSGGYLTGRLQPDGRLYVDRCGTVEGVRVDAVLAALFGEQA